MLSLALDSNFLSGIRQIDNYVDRVTQLKQAFHTFVLWQRTLPQPQPEKAKRPKRKKSTDGRQWGNNNDATYNDFVPYARKYHGTMTDISGKSDADVKTNVRVADQLTTHSIRWMIHERISEERRTRRAEAQEAGEDFDEASKGPIEHEN